MQHPFQALRLPVSMATSTPRYLYASHPRTGQLVLLSPVSDLNAISSLQQHLQQHHQQPSHLHQEQSLPATQLPPPQQLSQVNNQHQHQISQQKIKSPLQASQQSNAQVAMVSAILAKQVRYIDKSNRRNSTVVLSHYKQILGKEKNLSGK